MNDCQEKIFSAVFSTLNWKKKLLYAYKSSWIRLKLNEGEKNVWQGNLFEEKRIVYWNHSLLQKQIRAFLINSWREILLKTLYKYN